MHSTTTEQPIEQLVVLVGAGNAHLRFVRMWAMRPMPGVAVTLITPESRVPYSAMVPGFLGGDYTHDEILIDLVRLCVGAGVRLIVGEVTGIDSTARQVTVADRPPLDFDVLSLGLGSVPAVPGKPISDGPTSLVMRPLSGLIRGLDALDDRARHLVVVGGGASGCELALATHKRLSRRSGVRLSLVHAGDRLVPGFPVRTARLLSRTLKEHGITVRLHTRITAAIPGGLASDSGERILCDAVLWATDAAPPTVLHVSGLSLDASGFLLVTPTLQSVSDPAIFGTGDCVSFDAYPGLPRNGVLAVRQGAVLFANVAAVLRGRPCRRFRPQRQWLSLLNTADGDAILSYGPIALKGRLPRRIKDRIDRTWMTKFVPPAPSPTTSVDSSMRCGGCGGKVPSDVLGAVLGRLDLPTHPRVLIGSCDGEDAAVFASPDGGPRVEVQTVDHFRAFTDDPYLFGRIAALHALSDLDAMNARPFAALAIASLPHARGRVQRAWLGELLAGAAREFRGLGVALAGGHTAEGRDLALGFTVTGTADAARLFRKGGLQPGDVLVLTKPLGTGALLAAWMRGACRAEWFAVAVRSMLTANRTAAAVFAGCEVLACTDITGFGLAGHLLEMLDASGVSAVVDPHAVPLLPGFAELAGQGVVSSLHAGNAAMACRVDGASSESAWLFDPQTSGGLLAGVRPDVAADVVRQLRERGAIEAAIIGEVIALADEPRPRIRLAVAARPA